MMHNIPFTCLNHHHHLLMHLQRMHYFIDVAHPDPDLTWPQQLLLNVVTVFYKTRQVLSWMDQKLFLSSFNQPLLLLKGHSGNPRWREETSSWYKPAEDEEQDLSKSYLLVLSLPILLHCLHDPGIAPKIPSATLHLHSSSASAVVAWYQLLAKYSPGRILMGSTIKLLLERLLRLTLANFLACQFVYYFQIVAIISNRVDNTTDNNRRTPLLLAMNTAAASFFCSSSPAQPGSLILLIIIIAACQYIPSTAFWALLGTRRLKLF